MKIEISGKCWLKYDRPYIDAKVWCLHLEIVHTLQQKQGKCVFNWLFIFVTHLHKSKMADKIADKIFHNFKQVMITEAHLNK